MLSVAQVTSTGTISGLTAKDVDIDIARSGYIVMGVTGITAGNNSCLISAVYPHTNSTKVRATIRNTSSSQQSYTIVAFILYKAA